MPIKRYEIALAIAIAVMLGVACAMARAGEPSLSFETPAKPASPPPAKPATVEPKAVKPVPETKHAPAPVVPMAPSGAVGSTTSGAGVQTPAKPLLRFNHSKTQCPGCLPAAEFFRLYGKEMPCEIEDCEYENLDAAADAGVQFVPSLELLNKQGVRLESFGFNPYIGRRMSRKGIVEEFCNHDEHGLCPLCIKRRIREFKQKAASFRDKDMKDHVTAASRKVQALPFRSQVTQAFAVLKQARIGKFTIRQHCNDGDRILRVAGRNKSKPGLLAVCGKSGHVDIEAPGSLIPDGKLGFTYRIYSETRVGFTADEVIFDFGGAPKAAAMQQACGFGPFEILGVLSFVGGLMQSNVEVTLPRDIALAGEFSGGKIAARFQEEQTPYASLHVSTWWEQRAYFTTLDVTEADALVKTNGRWPLPKEQRVQFN